jgi:ABC-2 type transport system ATP-binding protein
MSELLQVHGITKSFGVTRALRGVDLRLGEGEILGLLGPNGAGKTTLVRSIVGRVRPDEGSIAISSRHTVGWVPQEIAIYPLLTVEENILTFGRYFGLEDERLAAETERALRWAGLQDRRGDQTRQLSGGMKRRLNMAAGVVHRPEIVLMDEPTVGVDPQSREKIYSMIEEMRAEGVGIIYTTHYMDEAERLCDRIAVIDHGRIIADGTHEELIAQSVGTVREARIILARELDEESAGRLSARGAAIHQFTIVIPIRDAGEDLRALLRELERANAEIRDLSVRAPTLERVFLHLTGRGLRE